MPIWSTRKSENGKTYSDTMFFSYAVCCIRILSIRIKISPVLNAYVVMTSSLLHKDTENFEKNKRFPSTEPFPGDRYRAYCVYLREFKIWWWSQISCTRFSWGITALSFPALGFPALGFHGTRISSHYLFLGTRFSGSGISGSKISDTRISGSKISGTKVSCTQFSLNHFDGSLS